MSTREEVTVAKQRDEFEHPNMRASIDQTEQMLAKRMPNSHRLPPRLAPLMSVGLQSQVKRPPKPQLTVNTRIFCVATKYCSRVCSDVHDICL